MLIKYPCVHLWSRFSFGPPLISLFSWSRRRRDISTRLLLREFRLWWLEMAEVGGSGRCFVMLTPDDDCLSSFLLSGYDCCVGCCPVPMEEGFRRGRRLDGGERGVIETASVIRQVARPLSVAYRWKEIRHSEVVWVVVTHRKSAFAPPCWGSSAAQPSDVSFVDNMVAGFETTTLYRCVSLDDHFRTRVGERAGRRGLRAPPRDRSVKTLFGSIDGCHGNCTRFDFCSWRRTFCWKWLIERRHRTPSRRNLLYAFTINQCFTQW